MCLDFKKCATLSKAIDEKEVLTCTCAPAGSTLSNLLSNRRTFSFPVKYLAVLSRLARRLVVFTFDASKPLELCAQKIYLLIM